MTGPIARFIGAILACALVFAAPRAQAAEDMNAAVDAIARHFAASRASSGNRASVAVTPLRQVNGATSEFTLVLMSALTGKMVEHGRSVFRVIERAQIERALEEIQLSSVPLFDRETARQFGGFLNADTLVVGEITRLSDYVRIDARLMDVETSETIEQASARIPLVPTVQRQLDTPAVVARPRIGNTDDPYPRNGIWTGTATCGQARFGVAVSILVAPDDTVLAMKSYYPLQPSSPSRVGVLTMAGRIDPTTGALTLSPNDMIHMPDGDTALGIEGTLDAVAGRITAAYTAEGCGDLLLRRRGD